MAPVDERSISRRSLLRVGLGGAGLVLASGSIGAVAASCSSSSADEDGADSLRALGRSLWRGPDGKRLAESLPPGVTTPLADQAAVIAALTTARPSTELDMKEGRTVLGRGWLLADSEAAILVAYARG